MSYDYSENILVQESAGNLLRDELGWDVKFAYNTEVLGDNGTFGRKSYKEILLVRHFRAALKSSTRGSLPISCLRHSLFWRSVFPPRRCFRSTKKSIS